MPRDHILLIDTSEQACSLALFADKQIVAMVSEIQPRRHGDLLLPFCQSLFEQAAIDPESIQAIAVTAGPGAFTGIRIGVAMVQGLAYGWAVPCIPVNTLDLWAATAWSSSSCDYLIAAMDARMGEVYARVYQKNSSKPEGFEAITDALCIKAGGLSGYITHISFADTQVGLIGSGIDPYRAEFNAFVAEAKGEPVHIQSVLSLQSFGEFAAVQFVQKKTVSAIELDALYLRPAVVDN